MNSEQRHLIHDLLDPRSQNRRETTLQAGAAVLRRRRGRRVILQSSGLLALAGVVLLSLLRPPPPSPSPILNQTPETASPTRSLTDAELLALFPDTPVGLITLEDGRKQLIFPRPGDEERFVKRF